MNPLKLKLLQLPAHITTSIPNKVIEHLKCSQLSTHLSKNRLLNKHQLGFRQKNREKLRIMKSSCSAVYWFQKSVFYKILLTKLSACGIAGDFYFYMRNHLQNRNQITALNGTTSNLASIECGSLKDLWLDHHASLSMSMTCQILQDGTLISLQTILLYTCCTHVYHVLMDLQKGADERNSGKSLLTIHLDKAKLL